jgi:hypothetical protein
MKELFAAVCSIALICGVAQAEQLGCKQQAHYEHHNMVDYGPLQLSSGINGSAIDPSGARVSGACVFVFTEASHHLVTATQADEDGRFKLILKHGRYRIIVKASPLCAANIPVHVAQLGSKNLVAHMMPAGIDRCSYGEAK